MEPHEKPRILCREVAGLLPRRTSIRPEATRSTLAGHKDWASREEREEEAPREQREEEAACEEAPREAEKVQATGGSIEQAAADRTANSILHQEVKRRNTNPKKGMEKKKKQHDKQLHMKEQQEEESNT